MTYLFGSGSMLPVLPTILMSSYIKHLSRWEFDSPYDKKLYYFHNPNDNTAQPATQPQHNSWVGPENDFANPNPPPTGTKQRPSGASD